MIRVTLQTVLARDRSFAGAEQAGEVSRRKGQGAFHSVKAGGQYEVHGRWNVLNTCV